MKYQKTSLGQLSKKKVTSMLQRNWTMSPLRRTKRGTLSNLMEKMRMKIQIRKTWEKWIFKGGTP